MITHNPCFLGPLEKTGELIEVIDHCVKSSRKNQVYILYRFKR